ncbi:hypothetical protein CPB83DRAFT_329092 [Crepidotus variabilis]|uniref:Uncharacterized protein n=1 Tax=Crepidotus variabilis TaxID=179855 RepID=A0A9P6ESF9_9AGAR|nr:hypothetical protein CPB83DRAFT_329092 [Crepidotus variabilis]
MSGQYDFLSAAKFLSTDYHDHNGTTIEILKKPPTALEFSRLVHVSRPAIIKGIVLRAFMSKHLHCGRMNI